jgi:hypothetical protein
MADDPIDEASPDTLNDHREDGGLASFVRHTLESAPEHPSPDQKTVPWSVVIPGFLVVLSVIVSVLAVFFDDAETLSDLSTAGRFAFVLLPVLFLVFLPWLGLALFAYSRRLNAGRRRTTLRIVGISALVVAALPWVFVGVSIIVALLSQSRP